MQQTGPQRVQEQALLGEEDDPRKIMQMDEF